MIKKLLLLSLFCPTLMWGQEYLRKNLNEEGTTYIKASLSATFWARYYEANPHTQINGTEVSRVTDFSVRRLRINVQGQLTPKLYVYGLFGGNNYNFTSKNEDRIGILDLYADYQLLPELTLGLGKFGWNGSRNAMKASGSMMGLDAPSFPLFTVNKNDDAVRSLGAFVVDDREKSRQSPSDEHQTADRPEEVVPLLSALRIRGEELTRLLFRPQAVLYDADVEA